MSNSAATSTTAAAKTGQVGNTWWSSDSPWMWLVLFSAVLIAYWPALGAGYIWDDAGHVTRADLRSLGGLIRIWFEPGATQQYYPVLHSAFWFEHRLWGDHELGYHLLNVLLHAAAACMYAIVLRRLAIPGAWLAALLFALHPVATESVAWISEQKNTLSTVFYLAAALAYLRFDGQRKGKFYVLATIWFCLALGTKTVTATLPATLLVVFWWKRGKLAWRTDVVPLIPWFGLALGAGIVTSWVERTLIGAAGADFDLNILQRGLLAGRVVWFYLGKLVWPFDLIFIYPRWQIDPTQVWSYIPLLGIIGVIVICGLMRRRALLAALLVFIGSLFPALGFINVFPFVYSYVADHFQYLPDLAIWAVTGAAAAGVLARVPRAVGALAVSLLLAALGVLVWNQTAMYHDVFALYETTLAKNPSAWMAHTNLGIALADAGRAADAVPHYEAALRLRPNYAEGENNLGYALNTLGHFDAAVPHLQHAIQLRSSYPEAHNNLGVALMNLGRPDDGRHEFETALQLNPSYPEAHLNLGLALANSGRTADAIIQFKEAARLRPDYSEAELNWAIGLTLSDQYVEAGVHFRRAIELSPGNAAAHTMFGRSLAREGQTEAAIAEYRRAIELNPNAADAHLNLALALRQLGRTAEAADEYQESNRIQSSGR